MYDFGISKNFRYSFLKDFNFIRTLKLLYIDLNNVDDSPICSNFPLSKCDLLRYVLRHPVFENCIYTTITTIKSIKAIDNLDSEYLKEFKIVLDPVLKQCEVSLGNDFNYQFNF